MRGFIEELRYRNVFRVAIAYIVAGWLIAQVADLAADAFGAPDWVMKMLIVTILMGLPVALFLAWAYELTPGGVKRAGGRSPRAGEHAAVLKQCSALRACATARGRAHRLAATRPPTAGGGWRTFQRAMDSCPRLWGRTSRDHGGTSWRDACFLKDCTEKRVER